ncbi:unnamed protein product [Ixodes pacificus]
MTGPYWRRSGTAFSSLEIRLYDSHYFTNKRITLFSNRRVLCIRCTPPINDHFNEKVGTTIATRKTGHCKCRDH